MKADLLKCDQCGKRVIKSNSVFRADQEVKLQGVDPVSGDRHLAPAGDCPGDPSRWERPEYQDWQKKVKRLKGFAVMDSMRQKQIASQGGATAHSLGTAHRFTSEEAREAGKKAGAIVGKDRAHMAAIARSGAEKRRAKKLSPLPPQR
jgi:general stress protein YciG